MSSWPPGPPCYRQAHDRLRPGGHRPPAARSPVPATGQCRVLAPRRGEGPRFQCLRTQVARRPDQAPGRRGDGEKPAPCERGQARVPAVARQAERVQGKRVVWASGKQVFSGRVVRSDGGDGTRAPRAVRFQRVNSAGCLFCRRELGTRVGAVRLRERGPFSAPSSSELPALLFSGGEPRRPPFLEDYSGSRFVWR